MENFFNYFIEFRFATAQQRKHSIGFAKEVLDMYQAKIDEMSENGCTMTTSEAFREAVIRRNATREALSKLCYRTSVKK